MSALLVLAWVFPLAAAAFAASTRFRWLPAVAALPALAAVILVPDGLRVEIPWLLLGSVLGLDETGRIFLAFTSILWLAAGLYATGSTGADPRGGRFRVFFLLAMAGNLWLILGRDLASFYVGFSLMGLASYGLVVHDLSRFALRAGKVYLAMTLAGELALFAALVLIAAHAGSLVPERSDLVGLGDLPIGLLLFGLAVKAGLVPLHVWLPLAHPAAPVPASAVLSGAMIKVALLGWLRFLPIGDTPLPEWGLLLVFAGLVTLFFALPIGLVQSNPKVILAYSSVSKMGLMGLILGLVLLEPALAPAGIAAIALYAAHHGLVKGGLFLSVGLRGYWGFPTLVLAGATLLALSLAAVPFSGGAVAKYGIKPLWLETDWAWLNLAIAVGTTGTALLMIRFLWVLWRTEPHPSPGHTLGGLAWGGLVVLSVLFSLLLGTPATWATDIVPIALALVIVLPFAFVAWRRPELLRPAVDRVPPGDLIGLVRPLLAILGYVLRTFTSWSGRLVGAGSAGLGKLVEVVGRPPVDPERGLRQWPSAGTAWLVITVLLLVLSFGSPPVQRPVSASAPGADAAPSKPEPAASPEPAPPAIDPEAPAQPEAVQQPPPRPAPEPAASPEPALPAVEPEARTVPAVSEPSPAPQSTQAPAPAAARPPEAPVEAMAPPIPAGTDALCDPDEPFVFAHPEIAGPLRLTHCEPGPDGPARLPGPPLTNALIERVQRHLQDLGFDPGPADGLIGPRTRDAVRRFERDQGDEPTGAIDFRLLEQIRAAAATASEGRE